MKFKNALEESKLKYLGCSVWMNIRCIRSKIDLQSPVQPPWLVWRLPSADPILLRSMAILWMNFSWWRYFNWVDIWIAHLLLCQIFIVLLVVVVQVVQVGLSFYVQRITKRKLSFSNWWLTLFILTLVIFSSFRFLRSQSIIIFW